MLLVHNVCTHVVVDCFTLTDPMHGQVNLTQAVFGAVANYSCKGGYILMGPTSRTCQSNGNWTEDAPLCQSKPLSHIILTHLLYIDFFSCGLFESHCSKQWSGLIVSNHF